MLSYKTERLKSHMTSSIPVYLCLSAISFNKHINFMQILLIWCVKLHLNAFKYLGWYLAADLNTDSSDQLPCPNVPDVHFSGSC